MSSGSAPTATVAASPCTAIRTARRLPQRSRRDRGAAGGGRRTPARLGFVAQGDLLRMDVAAGAALGHCARLVLHDKASPRWQLQASAEALDIGLLTASRNRRGDAAGAAAGRRWRRRGEPAGEISQATSARRSCRRSCASPTRSSTQPLAVPQLLDGTATLRGRADFRDAANAVPVRRERARPAGAAPTRALAGRTPAIGASADSVSRARCRPGRRSAPPR
jgi:translocation and assembly module TamB